MRQLNDRELSALFKRATMDLARIEADRKARFDFLRIIRQARAAKRRRVIPPGPS